MRAFTLVAAVLLAGCSDPATEGAPETEPGSGDSRQSEVGVHKVAGSNATRVLDHDVDWQPDASPPATTMLVPANATRLSIAVHPLPGTPCGFNAPEPGGQATYPYAEFIPPSGQATVLSLLAGECSGPVRVSLLGMSHELEYEPGPWQVTFSGRGADLRQHIAVDAWAS